MIIPKFCFGVVFFNSFLGKQRDPTLDHIFVHFLILRYLSMFELFYFIPTLSFFYILSDS